MIKHPAQPTIRDRVNTLISEFYQKLGVMPKELHCSPDVYAEINRSCFDDTIKFIEWRPDGGLMYCGLKLIPDNKPSNSKLEVR